MKKQCRKMLSVWIAAAFFALPGNAEAQQCPDAPAGYHVVQPKENLYRISKRYGVTLGELAKWNGISIKDKLSICQQLRVRPLGSYVPPKQIPETYSAPQGDVFTPKSKTSGKKQSAASRARKQGSRHVVKAGETVAQLADTYGFSEWKFRELNALGDNQEVTPGSILVTTECACEIVNKGLSGQTYPGASSSGTTTTTYYSAPAQPQKPQAYEYVAPQQKPEANRLMNSDERAMFQEINRLRKNPSAYAKYLQQHKQTRIRRGEQVDAGLYQETISALNGARDLPALEPSACLYQAALSHGAYMQNQGKLSYEGRGGALPWNRVANHCDGFQDGNENIVSGTPSVRDAVIQMLLDEGTPSRIHRTNLLNPHWTHLACYKVGKVGTASYAWVQSFGQENSGVPSSYNYNNTPPKSKPDNNNVFIPKGETSQTGEGLYMTARERSMLQEINNLRQNPTQYATFVEAYRSKLRRKGFPLDDAAVDGLLSELRATAPLSKLSPSSCVHNVARRHGQHIRSIDKASHKGAGGDWPWQRLRKACPDFENGNENFVAEVADPREAVILLLIDESSPSRTQRRNLLNPYWTHVACHYVGTVGGKPNTWIQQFGEEKK